jgi:hypothetical protein
MSNCIVQLYTSFLLRIVLQCESVSFNQDLLYWEVVQMGHFPKKLKILCDVTQYAYAECQVTKHLYTLAINLVTLKCEHFNCNSDNLFSTGYVNNI